MLDHKKYFQELHIKGIETRISGCCRDDDTMLMINKVIHCTVKGIEGHKDSFLIICILLCRLFKKCQHGTLTVRHVLAAGAVLTNRSQNLSQQLKLIRDEGIYLCKIFRIFVKRHMRCPLTEDNFIADGILFLLINRLQDSRCLIILLKNSLTDNLCYICRRKRNPRIKTALDL